jgi:hypothetical protein
MKVHSSYFLLIQEHKGPKQTKLNNFTLKGATPTLDSKRSLHLRGIKESLFHDINGAAL